LASNERRLRRAEKRDRGGNLGRMSEPPYAAAARRSAHLLEKFGVGPARLAEARWQRLARAIRLGLDAAGRDAVDGDSVPHDLTGNSRRQPDHGAFADPAEQRVVGRAGAPGLAADIDDAAISAVDHVRQYGLAA